MAVLDEAIASESGGGVCEFSDRDLYYAARELVQRHTSEPLSQSWFDKVVDEAGLVDELRRRDRLAGSCEG